MQDKNNTARVTQITSLSFQENEDGSFIFETDPKVFTKSEEIINILIDEITSLVIQQKILIKKVIIIDRGSLTEHTDILSDFYSKDYVNIIKDGTLTLYWKQDLISTLLKTFFIKLNNIQDLSIECNYSTFQNIETIISTLKLYKLSLTNFKVYFANLFEQASVVSLTNFILTQDIVNSEIKYENCKNLSFKYFKSANESRIKLVNEVTNKPILSFSIIKVTKNGNVDKTQNFLGEKLYQSIGDKIKLNKSNLVKTTLKKSFPIIKVNIDSLNIKIVTNLVQAISTLRYIPGLQCRLLLIEDQTCLKSIISSVLSSNIGMCYIGFSINQPHTNTLELPIKFDQKLANNALLAFYIKDTSTRIVEDISEKILGPILYKEVQERITFNMHLFTKRLINFQDISESNNFRTYYPFYHSAMRVFKTQLLLESPVSFCKEHFNLSSMLKTIQHSRPIAKNLMITEPWFVLGICKVWPYSTYAEPKLISCLPTEIIMYIFSFLKPEINVINNNSDRGNIKIEYTRC